MLDNNTNEIVNIQREAANALVKQHDELIKKLCAEYGVDIKDEYQVASRCEVMHAKSIDPDLRIFSIDGKPVAQWYERFIFNGEKITYGI